MKVSLDTNVFVGLVNKEPGSGDSKRILDEIDSGSLSCVLSTVVIAEMRTGYCVEGQTEEKDDFLTHVEASELRHSRALGGPGRPCRENQGGDGAQAPGRDSHLLRYEKGGAECIISNDESPKKAEKFISVL